MAELRSEYCNRDNALLLKVRYRNALGRWDSLIDGDTGKVLDLKISDSTLAGQANPQVFLENVGYLMKTMTRKVSILEAQIMQNAEQLP